MVDTPSLEEVLAVALKLPPRVRMQLIEHVASSVERDIAALANDGDHWGQELVALIDRLDVSDWQSLEINDPVEWVKQIQRQNTTRLFTHWNDPE